MEQVHGGPAPEREEHVVSVKREKGLHPPVATLPPDNTQAVVTPVISLVAPVVADFLEVAEGVAPLEAGEDVGNSNTLEQKSFCVCGKE